MATYTIYPNSSDGVISIYSRSSNTVDISSSEVYLGRAQYSDKSGSYDEEFQVFLEFDCTSVPYADDILSATLSLYNPNFASPNCFAKKYNWGSLLTTSDAISTASTLPTYASGYLYNGTNAFTNFGTTLVDDINNNPFISMAILTQDSVYGTYGEITSLRLSNAAAQYRPKLVIITTSNTKKKFKVAVDTPYVTASYMNVTSNLNLGGNLFVNSGSTSVSSLLVRNNSVVNGSQDISGVLTANNNFIANANASVSGTYFNAANLRSYGIDLGGEYGTSLLVVGGGNSQGRSIVKIGSNLGAGYGQYQITIGMDAGGTIARQGNISIGQQAGKLINGNQNIAIGYQSQISASSDYGIGIGFQAAAGTNSISIGRVSGTNGYSNSIAIGYNAQSVGSGAVAIGTDSGGNGAAAYNNNEIALGTSLHKITISGSLSVSNIINTGSLTLPVTTGRLASINSYSCSATNSTSVTASGTTPAGFGTFTLASGRLYEYKIVMFYRVGSAIAFKSYLTYPTLTRGSIQSITSTNTTAFSQDGTSNALASTSTTITPTAATAANTVLTATLQGILLPSASGTFSYQFGPASAGTASAMVGSYITVTEIG